jgi:TPP-dependent pyruvate/acetoin dehydrogenase alpha subunit
MPTKDKRETISTPAATPTHTSAFSLISTQKLLQLYSTMVKCRLIEGRARSLARSRKSAGLDGALSRREAVIVGAAVDLGPEDAIASLEDDITAGFIRGTPVDQLLRRISRRSGRSGRSSNVWPTPAEQLKSAVKAALAGKKDRSGNIAMVFSRSYGTASNSWRNALTLATRQMLPMIFVCHSGPHEPVSKGRRTTTKVNSPRLPRGLPVFKVDGSDVVAVYRVAHEAIARARKNRGPSLIECAPCCVSGNPENRRRAIRDFKAVEGPEAIDEVIDPILMMEDYLTAKGLFTAGMRHRIARGFSRGLTAALSSAKPASSRKGRPASENPPLKTP